MKRAIRLLFLFILAQSTLIAQMNIDNQILFGNEWLSADQTYYKIKVAEDGIFRIPIAQLSEVGFPIDQVRQEQIELFHFGKRVPIYISSLETDGFIEFYGQKNRAELDRYLFEKPEEDMLNVEHSLYTDTSIYYLGWSDDSNPTQYQVIEEDLNNQPNASSWYTQTDQIVNTSNFFQKRHLQDLVAYSKYDVAEGFAANRSTAYNYNFSLPGYVPGADSIRIKIRLASDRGNHHLQVKANNELVVDDVNWPAYSIKEYNVTIPEALVNNERITLSINGILGIRDWFRVAHVSVSYPKNWTSESSIFSSFQLDQVDQTGAVRIGNLEIDNRYILLNPQNETRQVLLADNNQEALAKLSNTEQGQSWILAKEETIRRVENIEPYQPLRLDFADVEYLIVSHSDLQVGAESYKDYRSSTEGGAYRAELVMADLLYDQFAYGIEGHPIAIRNYVNYLKSLGAPLDITFLLGKGLEYQITRNNASLQQQSLVPTFGTPGSDQLLASTPGATSAISAVGRISARSNEDINLYLESIKDYEAQQRSSRTYANHAWRKEAIHLVGGDVNEQPIFDAQMRFMELFAQENKWAANISKNTKLSSEPVPTSVSERIIDRVDDGVLIKAFLGHGSIIVTGFGLDDPAIFDHKGKYPLDFAFGCLTGNSYTTQTSVSERFVINPKGTGSIGYVASSGYGYPFTLGRFGGLYYSYLGNQHFNAGIGELLNLVIDSMDVFGGAPNISLSQQLNLQGDPAIKLFIEDLPDFVIDPSTVKVNPGIISVEHAKVALDAAD
ncbi:MAG: C25 family cysteine peptidase, partial [Bacteroidota bacterium]